MNQKNSKSINKNPTGFKRIPLATKHSVNGLIAAWKHESGFRQYATVSALLFPISFLLAQTSIHWLFLVGSLVFLLFSEIVNSAIEAVADATMPEYDPLIGRAKDLGSAAVFVALIFALIVWAIAIYEYFY